MRRVPRIAAVAIAGLTLAAGGLLAACDREPAPDPAAEAAALAAAEADSLFAATCGGLGMDEAVCACVRGRVAAAGGTQGLGYVGAAFGADPTRAGPYEAAMSQDQRNGAATAFLDGQFECAGATDPAAPPPADLTGSAVLPESPFEEAVAACFEIGAAPEPACRCRVETMFEAMGEDGVALTQADALGDSRAMARLADRRGGDWLDDAQDRLERVRVTCGG